MPRKPKDYRFFSVKMDRSVYERLERYCELEDRTKTAAAEKIIREYLDDYDRRNNSATKTSRKP